MPAIVLLAAGCLRGTELDASAVVPDEVAPLAERLAGADTLVLGGSSSTIWGGGGAPSSTALPETVRR
ncbi:MAG: hypothetical protein ACI8PZ_006740 [Myxococcota bacterium]|jgi:hypothetical protein